MRVLHTSDWHVGRRFKGIDLLDHQRRAFRWLEELIVSEGVDVLCVSGDVYDLPRPSNESVQVFDEAFSALGALEVNGHPLQVVITPGNHDSASRLGFAASLMRSNVHMRCRIEDVAEPVVITVDGRSLAVYAVPYLDPDVARPVLRAMVGHDVPRTHEGVMRAVLELVTADLARRRAADPSLAAILMAHAFVTGAVSSDSERTLAVGGVDGVPAALFSHSGLDYLALGHLHRPQKVAIPDLADGDSVFHLDRTPIARYSGSLLAYSFSERCATPVVGNGKSVVILDVDGGRIHDARTVDVDSGEPALAQVEGTADEVLGPAADAHADQWVSVIVHAPEFPRGIYGRIDARYPHALEKQFVIDAHDVGRTRRMADLGAARDEMDVLGGFVRFMLGRDATDKERRALADTVADVRKDEDR
ncbi:metallophosphoesterase family protein [Bifidobacterium minimum]|nr:exonuclease SbcCD subunit D [Bifidobacterium minimum]